MAAPIDPHSAGDILQLSMDLMAPLPEVVRLGGPGPFVINLRTSGLPIELPAKGIAACQAHLYRVQRIEDGRKRYRLRLGPFATEDEADANLKAMRDDYPSAFTATADTEDLRSIANLRAKMPAAPAAPALAAAPAPIVPAVAVNLRAAPSAPIAAKVSAAANVPTMPAKSAPTNPGADTEVVRALALLELEGDKNWRWFVIQLSISDEPVNPAAVPNLDIFNVYRLYSVAGIVQGRIMHALRLGFFAEEPAAAAVAGYVAAFYDKPLIKRVNDEERQRFAQKSLEPRKDMGATGKQAVIEITNERFVRANRSGRAAAK